MGTTRRRSGVLAGEIEPYREWLAARGYTPATISVLLRNLSQLGVWLACRGLPGSSVSTGEVHAMFAQCRRLGRREVPGERGVAGLLEFLRERGLLVDVAVEASPPEQLLTRFRAWLVDERNLAASTVGRYENTARRFVTDQAIRGGQLHVELLTGADVNAFLLRECARVSAGSAKGRVAELRALFTFLYLQELIPLRLGAAVPPVGGWRLATIPRMVSPQDVERVIAVWDAGGVEGARNRAMLLLVARLGLRSVEVARLELEDIDWRAGELTVRGKARREDRLPLPREVGDGLAAYLVLRGGHPASRRIFLTCRAPRCPIKPALVNDVVERGCTRAGIDRFGPHRMRHALAGELLRRGVGLAAISQVLRHQDLATTAVYAKVDLAALRQVARPWPVTR